MLSKRIVLCVIVLGLVALTASAQVVPTTPSLVKIEGEPLTIHVGADGSFQIFNSAVPGSGQIFPSSCNNTADMGFFARVGTTLIAPDFRGSSHGCGSATGGLGTYTPWGKVGLTGPTGDGSLGSPFTVTVRLAGGGVSVTNTITYVNGQNYFKVKSSISSSGSARVNFFLGADIYLASSDAGLFTYNTDLAAPGGMDCGTTGNRYYIFLIPITPATRFTASGYSDVWSQIGRGVLDNDTTGTTCVDNGAAIEWDNVLGGGTSGEITSAVSFGDIPRIQGLQGFFVSLSPNETKALAGDTLTFDVTTSHSEDAQFNAPLELSVEGIPDGMEATLDHTSVAAPGDGTAKLTVKIGNNVFPMTYRGLSVVATGKNASDEVETHAGSASIEVVCEPPFILSLPASQPQSQTVKKGSPVTIAVHAESTGAAAYQWYRGVAPLVGSPVEGATSAEFTTGPINELQQYWVRVSNACGTADSQTATIIPVD